MVFLVFAIGVIVAVGVPAIGVAGEDKVGTLPKGCELIVAVLVGVPPSPVDNPKPGAVPPKVDGDEKEGKPALPKPVPKEVPPKGVALGAVRDGVVAPNKPVALGV